MRNGHSPNHALTAVRPQGAAREPREANRRADPRATRRRPPATQETLNETTAILPAPLSVPERSSDKPPIADVLDYAIHEASDAGRDALSLQYDAQAADARRDAFDKLKVWFEVEAEARALELVRRNASEPMKRVSEPKVVRIPVLVDGELLKNETHPFFLGNSAQAVFRLLPERRNQWRKYFALYGCLACGRFDRPHVACGLCSICYQRTAARLRKVRKIPNDRLPKNAEQAGLVDQDYDRRPPEPEPLERWKCKLCGFVSKPMPQTKWELSARVLHEQGSRHQRALRRQDGKGRKSRLSG